MGEIVDGSSQRMQAANLPSLNAETYRARTWTRVFVLSSTLEPFYSQACTVISTLAPSGAFKRACDID
jgi:hypothetical protein